MILRISDRYIIRAFVVSFAICFLALVSLYVVVDSFTNLSSIISNLGRGATAAGASESRSAGLLAQLATITWTLVSMNAVRMPFIFYELVPVLTLSAAMFTVVKLKRANEIAPLLAAGVSIYRVVWPIFLMTLVLAVAQVVDREILIPRYSEDIYGWDRLRNENLYRFRSKAMMEDGFGNIVFAARYELPTKTQLGAQITRYWTSGPVRQPRVIVNAAKAQWQGSPQRGWVYSDGAVIEYDAAGNVLSQTPFGANGFFVPYVEQTRPPASALIATDASPPRLETQEMDIFYRPTLDLLEYAHHHGLRTDIALDLNKRLATPLSNIVLLLLGLPFVLKRSLKSPTSPSSSPSASPWRTSGSDS